MGQMIEAFDWIQTPLGVPDTWPPCLRTALGMVLSCKLPMLLCWGPELIQLYNDAYKNVLSRFSGQPMVLGRPAGVCCQKIWPQVGPAIDKVFTEGKSVLTENFVFTFEHDGARQESCWTLSASPAYDDLGEIAGVLLIFNETTESPNSRRQVPQLLQHDQALNPEMDFANKELAETNVALTTANTEIQAVKKQSGESEDKYKTLFQLSPLPMWVSKPGAWKILDVNETAIKKYGYSREEFLGMTLLDLRPAEDIPKFLAAQERVEKFKELQFVGTFRHLKKDGSLMTVEIYGHYFQYLGEQNMLSVANDVSEKEKALGLLKEKDDRLTTATAIAKLGYWQVDADGNNCYWSEEVFNIWRVGADTDITDWNCLLDKVHPEDRHLFGSKREALLGAFKDIDLEYRLVMPNSAVKWVREIGKVSRDKEGRPLQIHGTVQDITSRKLLALSLQESNERFQYAARLTSQAIWEWDATKPEIFTEYGYRELFGYKLRDNVGEVAFWRSKVHPEDYDRIWAIMEASRLNPSVHDWTIEYRFRKSDGQYLYLKEKAILLRDEHGATIKMIGAMHDITRRKHEERRLKLLESVITNTRDAVLVTLAEPLDVLGPAIVYANESFAQMTGYSVGELLGKTPRILQGPRSDKEELRRLKQALHNQEACEINIVNYRKNGEEYWVNISVSPVKDESGVVSHFIAIQRDITQKKKEEAEFKLFTDDLYKRNQELQQFGYMVSHNLRSPVANIIGIADLLELDKEDPGTVEKCTADLKLSVNRLDDVIRDLSKILSISDNAVQLTKERIDLSEILAEVVADLRDTIKRFDVEIACPHSPFIIVSHKAYLYSIFYNLISNSIKYRSENKPKIRVEINPDGDNIFIRFSDNGVGIDLSRHSEDIFKPYRRFHLGIEGKGLGLFLVKSHVEAIDGKISILSKPGEGTTFIIVLPAS